MNLQSLLLLALISPCAGQLLEGQDFINVDGLRPTENMSLVQDLKTVLNSYRYPEKYSEKFNCLDACAMAMEVLLENGFKPKLMARLEKKESAQESHVWLAVPDGSGAYAFVETTLWRFGDYGLGGVVIPEDVRAMGYDRGMMFEDWKLLAECFRGKEKMPDVSAFLPRPSRSREA